MVEGMVSDLRAGPPGTRIRLRPRSARRKVLLTSPQGDSTSASAPPSDPDPDLAHAGGYSRWSQPDSRDGGSL